MFEELTGSKEDTEREVLTVRREISSTLGLNTEIREFPFVRPSLLSQGDNCNVLLKKNFCCVAKANPKVKPSEVSTVVSVQGEKTRLLSPASTSTAVTNRISTADAGER